MFVTINYIFCKDNYKKRFEELFSVRAHAIDQMAGFKYMYVLKPTDNSGEYLIVSHWEDEENFKTWMKSKEFIEGHKRGFKDISDAYKAGIEPPMTSMFKTYNIISE